MRGRWWWVQDVVVAGDELWVRLVGDWELLHRAGLDQLLGKERTQGAAEGCPSSRPSSRSPSPQVIQGRL